MVHWIFLSGILYFYYFLGTIKNKSRKTILSTYNFF